MTSATRSRVRASTATAALCLLLALAITTACSRSGSTDPSKAPDARSTTSPTRREAQAPTAAPPAPPQLPRATAQFAEALADNLGNLSPTQQNCLTSRIASLEAQDLASLYAEALQPHTAPSPEDPLAAILTDCHIQP